jgi:hypothetical protein
MVPLAVTVVPSTGTTVNGVPVPGVPEVLRKYSAAATPLGSGRLLTVIVGTTSVVLGTTVYVGTTGPTVSFTKVW